MIFIFKIVMCIWKICLFKNTILILEIITSTIK